MILIHGTKKLIINAVTHTIRKQLIGKEVVQIRKRVLYVTTNINNLRKPLKYKNNNRTQKIEIIINEREHLGKIILKHNGISVFTTMTLTNLPGKIVLLITNHLDTLITVQR